MADYCISKVLRGAIDLSKNPIRDAQQISHSEMKMERQSSANILWSIGCILYAMCVFRDSFDGYIEEHIAHTTQNTVFQRIPNIYSDELWGVCYTLLNHTPNP